MIRWPLALLLLAGCVAAPTSPPTPLAIEIVADHDHASLAGHAFAADHTRIGGSDLDTLLAGEPGRGSDLQFHDGRGLAAMAVNGGAGGFVLLNATDLSVISRYRSGSEDN